MQITITISDDFASQVRARGLTPEMYVETLVAEQAILTPQTVNTTSRLADLELFFKEMATHSNKAAILSDEALTRESFYQDHD